MVYLHMYQKKQIWYILDGLGKENWVYCIATLGISRPFGTGL
jgi:hypothetical protein